MKKFLGKERLADGIISFPRRIALADGGHAAGSEGKLGKLAVPILAVRSVPAATPALRVRAVFAAVIVVGAGCPSHETFKSPMIAICKIHGIPPLRSFWGFAVYIKNPFHGETDFTIDNIIFIWIKVPKCRLFIAYRAKISRTKALKLGG